MGISGSCSRGLGWIWASLTCSSNLFRLSPGKNERQNVSIFSFQLESYNFSGEQVPHVLWGPGASQWEEWSGETGWDLSRVLWDGKTGKIIIIANRYNEENQPDIIYLKQPLHNSFLNQVSRGANNMMVAGKIEGLKGGIANQVTIAKLTVTQIW